MLDRMMVKIQALIELKTRLQKCTFMFSQKMSVGSGALSKVQDFLPQKQHEKMFLKNFLQYLFSYVASSLETLLGFSKMINTTLVKLAF